MAQSQLLEASPSRRQSPFRLSGWLAEPPEKQAYHILHVGFVAAPVLAGVDKFFNLLTHWTQYLSPLVPRLLPVSAQTFMYVVGVVEVIAGILVALKPRVGAYVVMAWLWGIILNLLILPGFFDVALRDFGLSLGALALARLAMKFDGATDNL